MPTEMLYTFLNIIKEKRNKSAKIAVKIMVRTVKKHKKRFGSIEMTFLKSGN
jgi:RNase adaptor protein for sRNA GlmZ degradation